MESIEARSPDYFWMLDAGSRPSGAQINLPLEKIPGVDQGRLTPPISGRAHGVLVARPVLAGPEPWARDHGGAPEPCTGRDTSPE